MLLTGNEVITIYAKFTRKVGTRGSIVSPSRLLADRQRGPQGPRRSEEKGGRIMHLTQNLSHLVCLIAGLCLALTGLLLRDAVAAAPAAAASPSGARRRHRAGLAKRLFLICLGLGAVGYGLSRML